LFVESVADKRSSDFVPGDEDSDTDDHCRTAAHRAANTNTQTHRHTHC